MHTYSVYVAACNSLQSVYIVCSHYLSPLSFCRSGEGADEPVNSPGTGACGIEELSADRYAH